MISQKILPESHTPVFKGVWIPAEIWEDERLTWFQRGLWAVVDSLSRRGRPCTASNEWLAGKMGSTKGNVHQEIRKLKEMGLLVDKGDEKKRLLFSNLSVGVELELQGGVAVATGGCSYNCLPTPVPIIVENKVENKERKGVGCDEEVGFRYELLRQSLCQMFDRSRTEIWPNDDEHYLCDVSRRPTSLEELESIQSFYESKDRAAVASTIRGLLMKWVETYERSKHPENERRNSRASVPASRNEGTYNTGKGYGELVRKQQAARMARAADVRGSGAGGTAT